MAFVHIKSRVPSLIYIDGTSIGEINDKNHYCLDLETPASFLLFALPISKSNPITCLIDFNSCSKKEDNVDIVPFHGNHFDILLHYQKQTMAMPLKELAYFATREKSLGVYDNGICYLSAYLEGSLKNSVKIGEGYTSASIKEINDYYCVVAEKENNIKHAIVLDNDFQVVFNDEISLLEKDPYCISLLSPQRDLFGHCKVTKIGEPQETYFVYEENQHKYVPDSLSALGLLQCIKVDDMSLAESLLSQNLKNRSNNLKEYFGEIKNIYYNSYMPDKQNFTIETANSFKSFSFLTDDGKIKDIIEEEFQVN